MYEKNTLGRGVVTMLAAVMLSSCGGVQSNPVQHTVANPFTSQVNGEDMAMPVDRCGSIGRQASRKSPWPAERAVADWGECLVWFALVPVGDRGHVVLSFEDAGFLGADLLPFDAQVSLEVDRVGDVPTV